MNLTFIFLLFLCHSCLSAPKRKGDSGMHAKAKNAKACWIRLSEISTLYPGLNSRKAVHAHLNLDDTDRLRDRYFIEFEKSEHCTADAIKNYVFAVVDSSSLQTVEAGSIIYHRFVNVRAQDSNFPFIDDSDRSMTDMDKPPNAISNHVDRNGHNLFLEDRNGFGRAGIFRQKQSIADVLKGPVFILLFNCPNDKIKNEVHETFSLVRPERKSRPIRTHSDPFGTPTKVCVDAILDGQTLCKIALQTPTPSWLARMEQEKKEREKAAAEAKNGGSAVSKKKTTIFQQPALGNSVFQFGLIEEIENPMDIGDRRIRTLDPTVDPSEEDDEDDEEVTDENNGMFMHIDDAVQKESKKAKSDVHEVNFNNMKLWSVYKKAKAKLKNLGPKERKEMGDAFKKAVASRFENHDFPDFNGFNGRALLEDNFLPEDVSARLEISQRFNLDPDLIESEFRDLHAHLRTLDGKVLETLKANPFHVASLHAALVRTSMVTYPPYLKAAYDHFVLIDSSSAETERFFSDVNFFLDKRKTRMKIATLNDIMRIRRNGAPISLYDPDRDEKLWVKKHYPSHWDRKTRAEKVAPGVTSGDEDLDEEDEDDEFGEFLHELYHPEYTILF